MSADADAIVIGAGHNGLVAAKRLAERGWNVLVLEAAAEPGGAVRSGELCEPGFTSDLFSSFHPLAAASPAIRSPELERFGLRWRRSPLALAHPQPGGACAVVSTDLAGDCGLARALRARRRRRLARAARLLGARRRAVHGGAAAAVPSPARGRAAPPAPTRPPPRWPRAGGRGRPSCGASSRPAPGQELVDAQARLDPLGVELRKKI